MNFDNLKIKSVVFDKEGTTTIIGKSAEEVLGYEDPKNILIDVAYCLDGNHTLNEIILTLRNNNIDISKEELKKIIKDIFIKNNLILDNSKSYLLSEKQLIKYDRLLLFFASYNNIDYITAQEMQKKLFDANVLVLGVGGTGGHTAHSLVASGVGNITLLDYDEIELTNVTRQMLYKSSGIKSND
ncbi:ThiF family adenylyltransferase, partial [Lactococcus garvieae]